MDSTIARKLEWFRDLKFGLMIHWGIYSAWGIVESWSLCREDEPWCKRHLENYDEYRRRYEELQQTFNPRKFAPDRWADAAYAAGMKYLVFTTKHHDGFNMFGTGLSDFGVTAAACPFADDPRADITHEVFRAFRARGFGIGAYYSKPDWHHPDYWAPEFPNPDRNVNYDTARHADRWDRFRAFTHGQIEELMSRYGEIDILWLDGGWVRPLNTITDEVRDWCRSPYDQDLDLPGLARKARSHQPGLLVVDRTVAGEYENYVTPEQRVPAEPPHGPWESCLTMGESWSWSPTDRMKTTRELIHLLVEIVCRGGNLLLNVAPDAQGCLSDVVYERLAGIGAWLEVNGEAIHGSSPLRQYAADDLRFTLNADGCLNIIILPGDDRPAPPERITATLPRAGQVIEVTLLGSTVGLEWEISDDRLSVNLPESIRSAPPCSHAWTLKIRQLH
ncbi:MAG: alpha-L-fucosidase [bacterium]|nr:alpha-L-fucosidase [bacterium]